MNEWNNLHFSEISQIMVKCVGIINHCRKWDVGVWIGLSWLRIGRGSGHS
jgi:hypothetical protein